MPRRLPALWLAAMVITLAGGASAADTGDVAQAFQAAVAASPDDYSQYRGQVLAAGEPAAAFLRKKEHARRESWFVRALAAAMLQRMEDPARVQQFEEEVGLRLRDQRKEPRIGSPTYRDPREFERNSAILRDGTRNLPFVIETLFKGVPQRVPDHTVIGYHWTDPRGAAGHFLQLIGGKTAVQAAAAFLLATPPPTNPKWMERLPDRRFCLPPHRPAPDPGQVLAAARLTDRQLADRMVSLVTAEATRPGAAWVLGELRDARAIAPLIAALHDPQAIYSRGFLGQALIKIGKPALPAVRQALLAKRPQNIQELAYTRSLAGILVALGETALPTLEAVLEAGAASLEVQCAVIDALSYGESAKVWPLLLKALDSPDPAVRGQAAEALARADGARARQPLLRALVRPENHNAETLERLTEALGRLKELRALQPLLALAADPDEDLRDAAAFALGMLGDKSAVPVLLDCLRRAAEPIRRTTAVRALGQIGDPAAVPALVPLLGEGSSYERGVVAWALGQTATAPIAALTEMAEVDPDAEVRRTAQYAVEQIAARAGGQ